MEQISFSGRWFSHLSMIIKYGNTVSPRGKSTLEIPQSTLFVDMRDPVLQIAERKLSYQFMAAEAYWILTGDDRVETIAPYNKHISKFSDDGIKFFGAYGPKITSQLDYVINKLKEDKYTRQAGLTIWRENPPETKDVPCTVAIFFNIRCGKLNCHVFMRSSDVWLGVPYDVFNFSMLSHFICAKMNNLHGSVITPGDLYITAASSHLYSEDLDDARHTIESYSHAYTYNICSNLTTEEMYTNPRYLLSILKNLRTSKPGDPFRWWEVSGEDNV